MLYGTHVSLAMFVVPASKMSFHQFESLLLIIGPSRLSTLRANERYLNFNRSYHNAFLYVRHRHFYLFKREILKSSKSFTPNPPLFFGRHTCFQLTQQVLCCSEHPPHKNILCILINSFRIFFGALKKAK